MAVRLRLLRAFLASTAGVALTAGCVGEMSERATDEDDGVPDDGAPSGRPGGGEPVDARCTNGPRNPGRAWTRRLTRFEYNNTVRDLLGVKLAPATEFPAEAKALGFDTNSDILLTTPRHIESFLTAAETLADASVARLDELAGPCDKGEEACASDFVTRFGRRAFRRPITTAERDRLLGVYRQARQMGDHKQGLRDVIAASLMSAPFLYRPERGVGNEGIRRLSSWEMASRLSYFFWGTMPDDELASAADRGELQSPQAIAKQAARLLDDRRASELFKHFHRQWLKYESQDMDKDPSQFPDFGNAARASLFQATGQLFERLSWQRGATLTQLFTEPVVAMDQTLAPILGGTVKGQAFELVRREGQRAGILTDPGLLAAHAGADLNAIVTPIVRGKWLQTQILCTPVPPPPPDVPEPPPVDPNATMRERLMQHRNTPACASCHNVLDPIGLAMETYDVIGRYRTTDRGLPIETEGELALDGGAVRFGSVPELGKKLADSAHVKACVATQWLRFGLARAETDDDACALEHMLARSAAKGGGIRELVLAFTETPPFQFISSAD